MPVHRKIEVPAEARLFLCTDVHGNITRLMAKLEELNFNFDKDYLISCGDLTDRGPDSLLTLNAFLNRDRLAKNSYAVLGNHELMLMQGDSLNLMYNGGEWAFEHTDETLEYLREALRKRFYRALTLQYNGVDLGVVHAEVQGTSWSSFVEELADDDVLINAVWGRRDIQDKDKCITDVKLVFMGHTPVSDWKVAQNRVYFDTGAFGELTLIEVFGSTITGIVDIELYRY